MLDQLTLSESFLLAVSAGLIAYTVNLFLRLGHIRMRKELEELRGRVAALEGAASHGAPDSR
jgi:hypothetical protein